MTTNVAIIGSGWGISVQLPMFESAGMEVVALWVRSPDKVPSMKEKYDIPLVTANWEEILQSDQVQLVSIVTPPHLHKEIAIAALRAGKHILCDKPFALNVEEALEMAEESEKFPQQMAILDHELRFLDTFKYMRQNIFGIGRIYHVDILCHYKVDLTKKHSWWSEKQYGGGILGAIGSHMIDLLLFLGFTVELVKSDLNSLVKERLDENNEPKEVTSDDCVSLILVLNGEIPCHLNLRSHPFKSSSQKIFIQGTNESLTFESGTVSHHSNCGRLINSFSEPSALPGASDNMWSRGTYLIAKEINEVLNLQTPDGTPDEVMVNRGAANFSHGVVVQNIMDQARAQN
eukprot:TRINITY_DN2978_c0_g1_i1.p1 TRINITY_DN2978_c0_g1~~TRINITY_DN2978_c0_g1_i1.p1  ORF type:complete len:346 (+),score=58.11 TRINITY_DN2978_c0_g1_i1:24-1061(+)